MTIDQRLVGVLLDRLPALVAYWDRDERNLIANQAYLEYFGLTPAEIRGMRLRDVLGEAVYAQNLPFVRAVLAGHEQLFERTLIDTSGRTRHTQASYVPDLVDGEVVGFCVLVTDVTPRVEAQQALDEAQRMAHLGSIVLDPATRVARFSAEIYRILGVDPDTFAPTLDDYMTLVVPEDRPLLAGTLADSAAGRPYEIEYRLRRPDGQIRWIHSIGSPELDAEGRVLRISATLQDVTDATEAAQELARINAELHHANQVQADLIAMLGHDSRQPLTAIQGYLDLVLDMWDGPADDPRFALVARALVASQRMSGLLDDVLAMAQLESGALACHPRATDVSAEIREVLAALPAEAGVQLAGDAGVTAWVDPAQLRHMIANLVGNAVKYGRAPLSVTVRACDGEVEIAVRDHGDGVPADFVPRLFARFARAGTGVAASMSGTGFGLYLVRALAEANGGSVAYRPGVPQGAEFVVTLPADAPGGSRPSR